VGIVGVGPCVGVLVGISVAVAGIKGAYVGIAVSVALEVAGGFGVLVGVGIGVSVGVEPSALIALQPSNTRQASANIGIKILELRMLFIWICFYLTLAFIIIVSDCPFMNIEGVSILSGQSI
jgi:hypothetical protein